ncbi:hypothetical protein WMY93_034404, partial [Mugilogobius chulae]
ISRRSHGPEGVQFGDHRITSLLFADDVVLMASSNQDLQHALGRFAAECEAAGMKSAPLNPRPWFSTGKRCLALSRWVESPCLNGGVQVSRGLVHE